MFGLQALGTTQPTLKSAGCGFIRHRSSIRRIIQLLVWCLIRTVVKLLADALGDIRRCRDVNLAVVNLDDWGPVVHNNHGRSTFRAVRAQLLNIPERLGSQLASDNLPDIAPRIENEDISDLSAKPKVGDKVVSPECQHPNGESGVEP